MTNESESESESESAERGSEPVGFVTMAGPRATGPSPTIGVGMLGYAFMGKAHSNAFKTLPYMMYPPPAIPELIGIAGRTPLGVEEAARRYGYAHAYTDWHDLLANTAVQLFDNGGPNDEHAAPTIAAAHLGKHTICEKPLGRTAEEARRIWQATQEAERQFATKHMVGFNNRFVPAIRQAYDLIQSGALGRIYHFRAVYLQEWLSDPAFPLTWRLQSESAGSGAIGDLGSHIIDLARWLIGEPKHILAETTTFIRERPLAGGSPGSTGHVTVDDGFAAVINFENGALGTLEASRFAPGRKNGMVFEINAEHGSLRFDLERLNELEVYWANSQPRTTRGFAEVLVSETYHPYGTHWWPQGHILGWEHSFIHEIAHLLEAIVKDTGVAPYGATPEDGYRNAVICDAIVQSAREGRRVEITY